ncbi:thioesterase domain-containing protein, partial [Planktotalea sp.]|uniref:thioesterase II family protein n=1 Tax=Planktotalea sp. TaxID=2029877 RepID=UPI0032992B94
HSLGALVAFEVAHALRDMGCPPPECLIVSGREGPRVPDFDPPLHGLPDAQFVREMSTRYDGIPQEILNEPDLLAMLLPAMRGDMSASETYEYGHKTRLSCPIVALGGTQDARVGMDELLAWGQETSGTFKTKLFAGGHFFLRPQQAAVMPFVKAKIAEFSKKEARHGLLVDS